MFKAPVVEEAVVGDIDLHFASVLGKNASHVPALGNESILVDQDDVEFEAERVVKGADVAFPVPGLDEANLLLGRNHIVRPVDVASNANVGLEFGFNGTNLEDSKVVAVGFLKASGVDTELVGDLVDVVRDFLCVLLAERHVEGLVILVCENPVHIHVCEAALEHGIVSPCSCNRCMVGIVHSPKLELVLLKVRNVKVNWKLHVCRNVSRNGWKGGMRWSNEMECAVAL